MPNTKNLIGLTINDTYISRPFVECDTISTSANKTASWPGFTLTNGATILVKFKNENKASGNLTLNVNATGAKPIKHGETYIQGDTKYWSANDIIEFRYDGIAWNIIGGTIYTSGEGLNLIDAKFSLKTSSSSEIGGIKVKEVTLPVDFNESSKNYPVNIDKDGLAYVNVPWIDTDIKYSNGTGINISNNQISVNEEWINEKIKTVVSENTEIDGITNVFKNGGTIDGDAILGNIIIANDFVEMDNPESASVKSGDVVIKGNITALDFYEGPLTESVSNNVLVVNGTIYAKAFIKTGGADIAALNTVINDLISRMETVEAVSL